jgi:hypothetical protein
MNIEYGDKIRVHLRHPIKYGGNDGGEYCAVVGTFLSWDERGVSVGNDTWAAIVPHDMVGFIEKVVE